VEQRKQNELFGIISHKIFQQQNTLIDEQKFNDLNVSIRLSHCHKTTRYVVRYPPQFSTRHPSTQATSTQGKSIIRYNSASVFILYQLIKFNNILNLIVFIAEYPDVYTIT
jgi:hypothetical protein